MLSKINLNLLRSLHVLLEECHVSKAAIRLHVTQSAVSRQLSQLRDLFGDPLLIREGNQLVPTSKAIEIKAKLDSLFEEFDHLLDEQAFEPNEWKGEMVFSSSDYVAQYIFPGLVAQASKLAPKASFKYVMWERDFLSDLSKSDIHLASTMLPEKPEGLSSILLGEDKSVVVMGKHHPLALKDELSVEDILGFPHILISGGGDKNSHIDSALSRLNKTRNIGLTIPFFSAAFDTLTVCDYLLVVPEHVAKNVSETVDITYRTFPLEIVSHKYWLIWHPKYDRDPAHRWMREQATRAIQTSMYSIAYDL
ncbi:LysR family transcriptional regulator [Vibrio hannami]|uniref:LysR family transcriptional regulator n=1 Tax=Vibrio hannami TaxID=2717094 RepID=UPI00240EA16A|nr:LysR family transcriptional regulator [Vibrio hannami]MDG3087103.1 LysR family transcriptional regulator [Vibrio hannami]